MENVLEIGWLNERREYSHKIYVFHHEEYPYHLCGISLPDINTGFLYILIRTHENKFCYIGKRIKISTRWWQHNSGHGSHTTSPIPLRVYALF